MKKKYKNTCIISGCAVAAWGNFLKVFTPTHQRIKSCVDLFKNHCQFGTYVSSYESCIGKLALGCEVHFALE